LYSFIAGIRGVAYSDVVQGVFLFAAAWAVGIYILAAEFNGPKELFARVQSKSPELLSLPGPKGLFTYAFLVSNCIIFASIPICQPQFLTRYLLIKRQGQSVAASIRFLKFVAIGMGVAIAIGTLPGSIIGLAGAMLHPDLKSGDQVLGTLLDEHFWPWFNAFVSVGVLAAAMSTADSILFSLGHLFSIDIYRRLIAKGTGGNVIVSQIFIFGVAVVAFLVALTGTGQLIVQLARISFSGTLQLVPSIIGGLWHPRPWRHAGTISVLSGVATMLVCLNVPKRLILGLDPGVPGMLIGTAAYLAVARVKPRPSSPDELSHGVRA
jgi:solute:Na+ symporter, SSS family